MWLNNKNLYIVIFVLSVVATCMSLYYSFYGDIYVNIIDWVLFDTTRAIKPCDMCWYMRIAQYPLVLLSWLTLRYKDYVATRKHIIWLSVLWLVISWYKVLLEYGVIKLWDSGLCSFWSVVSCDQATSLFWTPISLATAWFVVFVIIIICSLLVSTEKQ